MTLGVERRDRGNGRKGVSRRRNRPERPFPQSRRNRNRRRALASAASFPAARRAAATRRRNCWKSGPGSAERSVSGDSSPRTSASRSRSIRRWRAASRRPGRRTVSSACAIGSGVALAEQACDVADLPPPGGTFEATRAGDRSFEIRPQGDACEVALAQNNQGLAERLQRERFPLALRLRLAGFGGVAHARVLPAWRRHDQPVFLSVTNDLEIAMRAARGIWRPGSSRDLQ